MSIKTNINGKDYILSPLKSSPVNPGQGIINTLSEQQQGLLNEITNREKAIVDKQQQINNLNAELKNTNDNLSETDQNLSNLNKVVNTLSDMMNHVAHKRTRKLQDFTTETIDFPALFTKLDGLAGATHSLGATLDVNGAITFVIDKAVSDIDFKSFTYDPSTRNIRITKNDGSFVFLSLPQATTGHDGLMMAGDKDKLDNIQHGSQVNLLENIDVNGSRQNINDKTVNITVPTTTSQLTNNSGYLTASTNLTIPADSTTNGTADTAQKIETLPNLFNWLRQKLNWVLGSSGLGAKANASDLTTHTGLNTTAHGGLTPSTHVGSTGVMQHGLGNGTNAGFTTNDFTTAEKNKLAGLSDGAGGTGDIATSTTFTLTDEAEASGLVAISAKTIQQWLQGIRNNLKFILGANGLGSKQNNLNRTITNDDNATAAATDTGGNITALPTGVTLSAVSASDTQNTATTRQSLRMVLNAFRNNLAWLLNGINLANRLFSSTITEKATPVDADSIVYTDSANSNNAKRATWTNIKAFLKTYFGTLYAQSPESITSTSSNTTIADATTTHTHALADGAVVTAKVNNKAITYAKMQDVSASARLMGRNTDGAGAMEELTPAQVRTMINVAENGSVPSNTIRGRVSAGSGVPENLTATQVRTILGLPQRGHDTIRQEGKVIFTSGVSDKGSVRNRAMFYHRANCSIVHIFLPLYVTFSDQTSGREIGQLAYETHNNGGPLRLLDSVFTDMVIPTSCIYCPSRHESVHVVFNLDNNGVLSFYTFGAITTRGILADIHLMARISERT